MQSKENVPRHEIFITPLAGYGANQDTGQAMARDWLLGGEIFSIDIVDEKDPDKTQVHIFSNRPTS